MMEKFTKLLEEMKLIESLRHRLKAHYHQIGIGRVVGYLIFTSYFTALPILFKKIWPFLFDGHDLITVYIAIIIFLNLFIYVLYNLIMYFIYMAKHPFFEQYRDNHDPWPWEQNPAEWRKLKLQSVVILSINFFLILPFTLYVSTLKTPAFDFTLVNWPSTFEIVWQFTFFLLIQDFFVYLSHRMFHLKSFYWIHKYHHQFRQSVSLAFSNFHPIEYLVGFFPTSIGYAFLLTITKVHFSTVLIWLVFRIIHGCEIHSGYTWTWSTQSVLPFSIASDNHGFHHEMNAGNFGSVFIFWDAFFQTQTPFMKYLGDQVQKKEKRLQEKVK